MDNHYFLEKNPPWTALLGPGRLLNSDFAFFKYLLIAVLQAFYSTEHDINEQFYPRSQLKRNLKFSPLIAKQKS